MVINAPELGLSLFVSALLQPKARYDVDKFPVLVNHLMEWVGLRWANVTTGDSGSGALLLSLLLTLSATRVGGKSPSSPRLMASASFSGSSTPLVAPRTLIGGWPGWLTESPS